MNPLRGQRRRGEAAIVPEPVKPDDFVKRIQALRKHRLQVAESEMLQVKAECATSRAAMGQYRGKVAQAQADADAHWQQARADFQNMAITAKEFVARKARHQQLKLKVAALRNEARDAVQAARADRARLREAKQALQHQQRQVEKVRLLKDMQLEELARAAA